MTLVSTSAKGAGGGASLWTLIQTITRATDGTINFTAIPSSFSDLLIVGNLRGAIASATDSLVCQFNGDTGTNYAWESVFSHDTSLFAQSAVTATNIELVHNLAGNTAPASRFTGLEIRLPGYQSTAWHKTVTCVSTGTSSNITSGNQVGTQGGTWLSTAAITSILLFGLSTANLLTGSSLRLYGRS